MSEQCFVLPPVIPCGAFFQVNYDLRAIQGIMHDQDIEPLHRTKRMGSGVHYEPFKPPTDKTVREAKSVREKRKGRQIPRNGQLEECLRLVNNSR